ncbi:MAG TPA: hypothetical protein VIM07_15135 [Chitinophagaceae bacterium]
MKILQLILAISFTTFLFSCSISKKNQRAVNRVKADINLLNDVGNSWQLLHPCQIDTIIQFKNGKEIVRYDTLDNSHTDTVYNTDAQTKTIYKTVVKYVNKTDTIFRIQTDKRAEQIALDKVTFLEGQTVELKLQKKDLVKSCHIKLIWIIAEGLVILLLIIVVFRFIFTPKIPKI